MKKNVLKISVFLLCMLFSAAKSQTSIKGNLATASILIPNFGIETTLTKHFTFQIDAQASFWESFKGGPAKFLMVFPELRYYPNESKKGFFVGGHIGGSTFNIKKWNYFDLDKRQQGYNVMYGATIGYQFELSNRLNMEVFLGGGNQQGYYKGYYISTGKRYDDYVKKFNKSGEWLPYRAGLMLVYKLQKK